MSDPQSDRRPRAWHRVSIARRAGVWLFWWILMMSFWIIEDDSLRTDELLAGAGAAALAATLAELAGNQAATRLRMRIAWLIPALRLPGEIASNTWLVFAALGRRLAHGTLPSSGFDDIPVRYGGETLVEKTRRALLVAGTSLPPNTVVLSIDRERGVMIVHRLVPTRERHDG